MHNQTKLKGAIIFICILLCGETGNSQKQGIYPPFTKWYQDPLCLKPMELSTAFGFVWGTASVAACLIFTKKDSSLKKRISIYHDAGFSVGYKSPYTTVFQNETGFIYSVRKWMAVGFGSNAFHFRDKINNTWSFGIRPFARWYPYKSKKVSLFFEYGAGLSYSLDRFPLTGTGWEADTARIGTRFNLTSKYGVGGEVRLSRKFSLQTAAKHFHLSNGNIKGIRRNPSHDSNGFSAGFIYKVN